MTSTHPATEQLTAYGLGKLSEAQATEVAAHLEDCEPCQQAVLAIPDDSLVGALRPLFVQGHESAVGLPLDSWVPEELIGHPRYRLLEWLGAGGMGTVFKAEHRLMERLVAIKVISKRLTTNPAAVERFKREVKAAAKLDHPNIVRAYDAEQAGDLHFLVMEYIEGVSLARSVEDRGPLPVQLGCDYARQAASGLQHAWERGIRHRDLKPTNLMVTPKGVVKILDFGLAGFVSGDDPQTEFGAILGTPSYMAPEQGRDAHSADIRADIYALGCTLYFLLAGRTPFVGGTVQEKLAAHREHEAKPLSEIRQDVSEGLVRVVARMMTKEPDGRYQTPAEVAEALATFAGAARRRRRWFGWLWGGAAAGIVVVVVYIGLFSERRTTTDAPAGLAQGSGLTNQGEVTGPTGAGMKQPPRRDTNATGSKPIPADVDEVLERLDSIKKMAGTDVVDYSRRTLTEDDFSKLSGYYLLQRLILTEAKFDERYFDQVRGLHLRYLHLERTPITDDLFDHLDRMLDLEELYLNETNISDAAMKTLPTTGRWQRVDLRGTQVTEKGIELLRQRMPNCKIDR